MTPTKRTELENDRTLMLIFARNRRLLLQRRSELRQKKRAQSRGLTKSLRI